MTSNPASRDTTSELIHLLPKILRKSFSLDLIQVHLRAFILRASSECESELFQLLSMQIVLPISVQDYYHTYFFPVYMYGIFYLQ